MLTLLAIAALAQEQHLQEWPLTHRWADTPEAYFEGLHRDLLLEELGGSAVLDALDYEVGDQTAHLWVPESYQPDGTWGALVFVHSNGDAPLPSVWLDALEAQKLVYVAVNGVGNSQESVLRIAWTLDALASVEAAYVIDPDRRVISGFSGGGAVSVLIGSAWPDVFVGTIDQCRALMWEEHPIATLPGSVFATGEITHMDPEGLQPLRNRHRFAFISGDRDVIEDADGTRFSNYEGLLKGMGDWWDRDLRARLFDVPEMEHTTAGRRPFELALDWVLTCTDTGEFPTRFDSDHMPPHTPVPTPSTPAPDPCDPGDPGAKPAGKDPADEAGCGCGGGGSAWLVLPLLFGARRRRRAQAASAGGCGPSAGP